MENEIVPYDESLALAQIGFVQSCWHAYHDLTWPSKEDKHKLETFHNLTSYMSSHAHQYVNPVLAPTYSQAFRWFREQYGLCLVIKPIDDKKLDLGYNLLKNGLIMSAHLTYETAELFCLRKLIEIIKNKNND
jgi:hypothetical protein